ncbi:F-box protein At2g16365 [Linum perenne]
MSNEKERTGSGGSQSSWIGHWMGKNCRVGNEAVVANEMNEEIQQGIKCHRLFDLSGTGSDGGDRFRDVGKRKMVDFIGGSSTSTRDGLERLKNEPSEGQPYLMLGVSMDEEIALPPVKKRVDSARIGSHLAGSSATLVRHEVGARHKNGLGLDISPSQIVPYEFDRRNQMGSSSWDCKKKIGFDGAFLVNDPSTSKTKGRDFATNQVDVNEMPLSDHFTFKGGVPTETDTEMFHGSRGLPGRQAMRIRTTIDSVTEFPTGCAKVSHTTHHFFITKKSDMVDLPDDEGQMFQQSSLSSTKLKGNPLYGLFGLKPDYHHSRNNQGVKLQQLDSSTENGSDEDNETIKVCLYGSKSESSSDTNTMDMDAIRHNHLRGLASQSSSKDMKGSRKSPVSHDLKTLLPDINEEFCLLPDASEIGDDKETSTSITQSLDVECVISHPHNSVNLKSSACPDPVKLDPCARWVRRLKPTATGLLPYPYGSKSPELEEGASDRKVDRVFTEMIKCAEPNSVPKISNPFGNDLPGMIDCPTILSERNAESTSNDSEEKTYDVVAQSHPWIRRWSHNPVASTRRKADCVMASESRVAKGTSVDVPEKQFPSIAAMALMGKSMTGFRPCEFRKRGCLIVWSTKGY